MPWGFTLYAAYLWEWMEEARELDLDHQRWDGESPAHRGDD